MSKRPARSMAMVSACVLGVLWAACSKSESKTDSVAAATDTSAKPAAATPTTDTTATATATPLTDANIAALLDEANAGDSAMGKIAATKATNASVKDFGRTMERDHHKLREQGQSLAKKENLAPTAPSNDTLASSASKMQDSLNAMPKGKAWDKAYIDNEVAVHQSVLNLLQTVQTAATDTSLKALITKAQPLIQAHLTKAQSIQAKLGSAGSDSAMKKSDTTTKKKKTP